MMLLIIILVFICIQQLLYLRHIHRQLEEWLVFIKDAHKTPQRNFFVKGNNILAEINFELNRILKESRRQFVKLQRAEAASHQLLSKALRIWNERSDTWKRWIYIPQRTRRNTFMWLIGKRWNYGN